MRHLLLCSLLLVAACASAPTGDSPSAPAAKVDVASLVGQDLAGGSVALATPLEAGRPVALVFWQTWCGSCREEMPEIAAAARTWGDRITFVGVVPGPDDAVDEAELRKLVDRFALTYPQVRDRDLSWTKALAIAGTPTIVVIGEGGRVLYDAHEVPGDWGSFLAP